MICHSRKKLEEMRENQIPEIMTAGLAAMYIGVHISTIYRCVQLPGKTLVRMSDIDTIFDNSPEYNFLPIYTVIRGIPGSNSKIWKSGGGKLYLQKKSMAIKLDCPKCGRKNVEGRVYRDEGAKVLIGIETVCGTIGGFLIGGPVGAMVGGTLMKKGFDVISKDRSDGKVLYLFTCPNPNCKHEWKEYIVE